MKMTARSTSEKFSCTTLRFPKKYPAKVQRPTQASAPRGCGRVSWRCQSVSADPDGALTLLAWEGRGAREPKVGEVQRTNEHVFKHLDWSLSPRFTGAREDGSYAPPSIVMATFPVLCPAPT